MAGRAAGEAPILDIWVSAEFFAAAKTSRLFPAGILAPKAAQLVVEAKRRAAIFKSFFFILHTNLLKKFLLMSQPGCAGCVRKYNVRMCVRKSVRTRAFAQYL